MFDIETDDKNNLIIATPGLVLVSEGLPHWKDAAALFAHIKLVRQHEALIPKVALVSDSTTLSIMPALVDHFLDAKIRHFPQSRLSEAKEWAALVDPSDTSLKMIEGLPDDVVAYEVIGTLTSRDYDHVLTPLIDKKLKEHDTLKVLVVLGEAFDGATPSALWDDARLGFRHLSGFSKIAVVTDLRWVSHSAKLFGPLIPGQVHVFALDELDDAKEWITS